MLLKKSCLIAALCSALASGNVSWAQTVEPTVSAAVGAVLKTGLEQLSAQKAIEALQTFKTGLSGSGLSEFEVFALHRGMLAAAGQAGQWAQSLDSARVVMASPFAKAAEVLAAQQSTFQAYFKLNRYADAQRFAVELLKANPTDLNNLDMRLKSAYLGKDYAASVLAAQGYVQALEAKATKPSEETLKIYAHSAAEAGQKPAYRSALKLLLQYYPSVDYWSDMLYGLNEAGGFAKTGEIHFYRLLQASQSFKDPGELIDAAELAILAGFPLEAKSYLKLSAKPGLGPTAELKALFADKNRQVDKLIEQDAQQSAKIGKAVSLSIAQSYNLVLQGQVESGLQSMQTVLGQMDEKGKTKASSGSSLAPASLARLNYAWALWVAGKRTQAAQEFNTLSAQPELKPIAELWAIVLAAPASGPQ